MVEITRRTAVLASIAALTGCGSGGSDQGSGSSSPGSSGSSGSSGNLDFDVVIYGTGLAGLMALVRAGYRRGKRVCVIEPYPQYGGMPAAGISATDYRDKSLITGDVLNSYYTDLQAFDPNVLTDFLFEPKNARKVAETIISTYATLAMKNVPLDLSAIVLGASSLGKVITGINTPSGLVTGKVFIDASYEGDVMAAAVGSSGYTFGRESRDQYNETRAGYLGPSSPVTLNGSTGSLAIGYPYIPETTEAIGAADDKVQSYNFRVPLTRDPANRLPFIRPSDYALSLYTTELRVLEAMGYTKFARDTSATSLGFQSALPNGKINWNGLDLINGSVGYADGTWAQRQAILGKHVSWQQGLMWAIANDPGVHQFGLAALTADAADCGLCQDEFTDSALGAGWPFWLYARETRRMKAVYTMTEKDQTPTSLGGTPAKSHSIGKWFYAWDIHAVQGLYKDQGNGTSIVYFEGNTASDNTTTAIYAIPADCIVPPKATCANLIVPVCGGFTHVSWAPQRMEVPFGLCGEAAGEMAALAIDGKKAVQDYDYSVLSTRLKQFGSVL